MGFIKKYLSLVLPVGLVLAAALLYIPTRIIGGSVSSDIARGSLAQGKQIEKMLRNVPSAKQFEMEMYYQDRHTEDAMVISEMAAQSTRRGLISYQIFPEPKDSSQQLFDEFASSYCEEIKLLVERINSREAPNENDLKRKFGNSYRSKTRSGAKKSHDRKVDAACQKRARSISVYAAPQLFSWYNFWSGWTNMEFPGRRDAIEYCWYSQIAYWIYQDIVDSILQMNSDSDSVLTSPVKRLIGMSFQKPVTDKVRNFSERTSTEDLPKYVTEPEFPTIGPTVPWTGRISDKGIDVVHFSVAVIIDASEVMPFMKSLCSQKEHTYRTGYSEDGDESVYKHNQITILNSEIKPVDLRGKMHQYYRYGNNAVVRLALVCEYIFDKSGYDKIKPKSIKNLLDPKPEKKAVKSGRRKGNNRK